VAVDPLLTPWSGDAYRHVPAGLDVDVLDFRYAGHAGDNRWNVAGEPTLYLASDRGVVIAEFARHLSVNIVPGIEQRATVRQIYRLRIAVAHLLDLRDHRVLDALSIDNAPTVSSIHSSVGARRAPFVLRQRRKLCSSRPWPSWTTRSAGWQCCS
jgi:RES domain-containing protein